ncbi:MAG: DUF2497 domain-containing protein [Rhizobiaceae bacterium]
MANAAKNEPSMDDILSSIRKIVSQEDRRSGTERRLVGGQESATSAKSPALDNKPAETKPLSESTQTPSRRADDQPDKLNLASLAGMVRDQKSTSENAGAKSPIPEVTLEPGQALQKETQKPSMSDVKSEMSGTLADLQRTVSSHFNKPADELKTMSGEATDMTSEPASSNGEENSTEAVEAKSSDETAQEESATPPAGAMTLKDLADSEMKSEASPAIEESAATDDHSENGSEKAESSPEDTSLDSSTPMAASSDEHPTSSADESQSKDEPVLSEGSAASELPDAPDSDDNSDEASETEAGEFREALVAPSTQTAVNSSIDRLKKSVMDDLDARVESVLRPMLREWLDDNLPTMVEKAVREEIERIARQD